MAPLQMQSVPPTPGRRGPPPPSTSRPQPPLSHGRDPSLVGLRLSGVPCTFLHCLTHELPGDTSHPDHSSPKPWSLMKSSEDGVGSHLQRHARAWEHSKGPGCPSPFSLCSWCDLLLSCVDVGDTRSDALLLAMRSDKPSLGGVGLQVPRPHHTRIIMEPALQNRLGHRGLRRWASWGSGQLCPE